MRPGIAMMLDLGEYREESVNIIAIMGPHGVYHKDEPIKELEAALQRQGFQTIWPQNSADLLQFIEHNPRICGVIFDWDEYSVDLCSDINQLNEYLPLYAFINAHSTMDVSSQDLRMTLWFFEYALGLSEEIATRIGQYTREYRRISLRRLPARCSTMSVRENIPSVRRVIWRQRLSEKPGGLPVL
nr:Lysine decarboxylase, constitutive [Klebsiella pneumoniae]